MLNKLSDFLSTIIAPASVGSHPEHTLQLATAVLLIEVMRSDADSTDEEQATILNILKERFQLPDAEVAQLSEKVRIIEYMWQVAYADRQISAHENHLMRRMADLLHISHGDYIAAKMRAKPANLK